MQVEASRIQADAPEEAPGGPTTKAQETAAASGAIRGRKPKRKQPDQAASEGPPDQPPSAPEGIPETRVSADWDIIKVCRL